MCMGAGPPQLMMAFTGDGAADPCMVAKRDAQYGTNSDERKTHREQALDFSHQPSKAADHWMQGNGAYQLQLNKTDFNGGMPGCACCLPSSTYNLRVINAGSTCMVTVQRTQFTMYLCTVKHTILAVLHLCT